MQGDNADSLFPNNDLKKEKKKKNHSKFGSTEVLRDCIEKKNSIIRKSPNQENLCDTLHGRVYYILLLLR